MRRRISALLAACLVAWASLAGAPPLRAAPAERRPAAGKTGLGASFALSGSPARPIPAALTWTRGLVPPQGLGAPPGLGGSTPSPAAPPAQAAVSDPPGVARARSVSAPSEAPEDSGKPLQPTRSGSNALQRRFQGLRATFHIPEADQAPSPGLELTGGVLGRIHRELQFMLQRLDGGGEQASLYDTVLEESASALREIAANIDDGRADPKTGVRASSRAPKPRLQQRMLRLGVYPVAADPFQWGHLLIALKASARHSLDKVVFMPAGSDPRKPEMTPVAQRHPMGRLVLAMFRPLFQYSPLAVGTHHDGETNFFRLMALNPGRAMESFYLVGDDHYGLLDKRGNPDTLAKLEKNIELPFGHDRNIQHVRVLFIEREGRRLQGSVPTRLPVDFLPHVGFQASSAMIRKEGRYELLPGPAYRFARRLGLYGLSPPPRVKATGSGPARD